MTRPRKELEAEVDRLVKEAGELMQKSRFFAASCRMDEAAEKLREASRASQNWLDRQLHVLEKISKKARK